VATPGIEASRVMERIRAQPDCELIDDIKER
jgi:hypothetical protein